MVQTHKECSVLMSTLNRKRIAWQPGSAHFLFSLQSSRKIHATSGKVCMGEVNNPHHKVIRKSKRNMRTAMSYTVCTLQLVSLQFRRQGNLQNCQLQTAIHVRLRKRRNYRPLEYRFECPKIQGGSKHLSCRGSNLSGMLMEWSLPSWL